MSFARYKAVPRSSVYKSYSLVVVSVKKLERENSAHKSFVAHKKLDEKTSSKLRIRSQARRNCTNKKVPPTVLY